MELKTVNRICKCNNSSSSNNNARCMIRRHMKHEPRKKGHLLDPAAGYAYKCQEICTYILGSLSTSRKQMNNTHVTGEETKEKKIKSNPAIIRKLDYKCLNIDQIRADI